VPELEKGHDFNNTISPTPDVFAASSAEDKLNFNVIRGKSAVATVCAVTAATEEAKRALEEACAHHVRARLHFSLTLTYSQRLSSLQYVETTSNRSG
jgi:hypothetical protein